MQNQREVKEIYLPPSPLASIKNINDKIQPAIITDAPICNN